MHKDEWKWDCQRKYSSSALKKNGKNSLLFTSICLSNNFSPCSKLPYGSTSYLINSQGKVCSENSEYLFQDRLSSRLEWWRRSEKVFAHQVRISSSVQSQIDWGEQLCFNLAFYFKCSEMFWMTLRNYVCGFERKATHKISASRLVQLCSAGTVLTQGKQLCQTKPLQGSGSAWC